MISLRQACQTGKPHIGGWIPLCWQQHFKKRLSKIKLGILNLEKIFLLIFSFIEFLLLAN